MVELWYELIAVCLYHGTIVTMRVLLVSAGAAQATLCFTGDGAESLRSWRMPGLRLADGDEEEGNHPHRRRHREYHDLHHGHPAARRDVRPHTPDDWDHLRRNFSWPIRHSQDEPAGGLTLAAGIEHVTHILRRRRGEQCKQRVRWYMWTPKGATEESIYGGRGKARGNVGDKMNIPIGRALLGVSQLQLATSSGARPKVLAIGSTLPMAFESDVVVGPGWNFKAPPSRVFNHSVKSSSLFAVRGLVTCAALAPLEGVRCPDVYGDPALFAQLLVPSWQPLQRPSKCSNGRCGLCIVPHATDAWLRNQSVPNATVMSTAAWPIDFASRLLHCGLVASSALHGIVIADALRVPSVWLWHEKEGHEGGFREDALKFVDYFSGIAKPVARVESVDEARALLGRGVEPRLSVAELVDLATRYIEAFPFEQVCGLAHSSRQGEAQF